MLFAAVAALSLLNSFVHETNAAAKCIDAGGCPNCSDANSSRASCPSETPCCRSNNITSKMCREYGKYVYSQEAGGALLPTMRIHSVSQCHIEFVPLVVGGEKARAMEFPHMVAIGYGKSVDSARWNCGGSLISERFVLSAAHCTNNRDEGPANFARLGTLLLGHLDGETHVQDFRIVERINHPEYKPPSRYHDIALFKLSDNVEMNPYARPACLHAVPDEHNVKIATATGWGKLNYADKDGSDHLMKVNIDIIGYEDCNSTFAADAGGRAMRHGVIDHQLCAGKLDGGKDTCHGDSGGPLQIAVSDPYCMYDIIGVTSFGKFCGFKNSPAVYTRVSYYVGWIASIVWP